MIVLPNSIPDLWILCRICAKSFRIHNLTDHKLQYHGRGASEKPQPAKSKRLPPRVIQNKEKSMDHHNKKSFLPKLYNHCNSKLTPKYEHDANNNDDILWDDDSVASEDTDSTGTVDTSQRLKIYRRQGQDKATKSIPKLKSSNSRVSTKTPHQSSLDYSIKPCRSISQNEGTESKKKNPATIATLPRAQPRIPVSKSLPKLSFARWDDLPEPEIILDRCDSSTWRPPMSAPWDLHGNFVFQCHTCPAKFRHPSELSAHTRTHNSQRHECRICERKFPFVLWLEQHMRTHTDPPPKTCIYCHDAFPTTRELNLHMDEEHLL